MYAQADAQAMPLMDLKIIMYRSTYIYIYIYSDSVVAGGLAV